MFVDMGRQLIFDKIKNSKGTEVLKDFKSRVAHGGSLGLGQRKLHRPLDIRRPIHLILKSSQAKGTWSFMRPNNMKLIDRILFKVSSQFRIKVFKEANSGNHLHLIVKADDKNDFKNFLRTLTALLARRITNARKGHPLKKRFWDHLAFTRLVTWGREFSAVKRYLTLNTLETLGAIPKRDSGQKATKRILDIDLEEYLDEFLERNSFREHG
jgi:REP element-mobilizing transposase RayT